VIRGAGVFALAMAAATPAAACSCHPLPRSEIVRRADVVIEGTVAVVTEVRGRLQATIDVVRVEKGVPGSAITVVTPALREHCGIPLAVAQRVTIAAFRDGPIFRTDLCSALALQPNRSPQR